MKTITVKPRQTIWDVAIENYGTCEAVSELLALNPDLTNDPAALARRGIDALSDGSYYMDVALQPGSRLIVDNQSELMRRNVLRMLRCEITTCDAGDEAAGNDINGN